MAAPGRRVRIHLLNRTGASLQPKDCTHYLSGERLKGIKRLEDLKYPLYAYPISEHAPTRISDVLTTTMGTRTETVGIGLDTGGVIQRWVHEDSSAGYSIETVNRYGLCGREFQAAMFMFPLGTPSLGKFNPTTGGTAYGARTETFFTLPDGYDIFDITQGAPLLTWNVEDLGGGAKRLTSTSVPLEFTPDLEGPEATVDKGGSMHDAIVHDGVVAQQEITVNWDGNSGIHRLFFAMDIPAQVGSAEWFEVSYHVSIILGYDEIHFYDADWGTFTRGDGVNIYDGLSSPSISSVTGSGDLVTVTFSAAHDRTPPSTNHQITLSGWTGSPSIDGNHIATFATSTTCTFTQSGAAASYTGGSLSSVDMLYAEFDTFQIRRIHSDLIKIDPGGVDTQTGVFPGKQLTGSNRVGVALRAVTPGVESWSFDEDFAVGIYIPPLSTNAEKTDSRGVTYKTGNYSSAPLGVPTDQGEFELNAVRIWKPGSDPTPAGTVGQTVYYCVGTWSEVQAHFATLDGYTNEELGWDPIDRLHAREYLRLTGTGTLSDA